MAIVDDNLFPKVIIRESANDGSDFSNPTADYRVLFLGEDGDLHLRDSAGTVTTPNAGGGGGGAHSFLGYNTIGGSQETVTPNRWYSKQITAPADGIITGIYAYFKWGADDLGAGIAGLFEDVNGSPDTPNKVLATNGTPTIDLSETGGSARNPRWFMWPCGYFVTAGDYWIGVTFSSGTAQPNLYYDTSGSDRYWTPGGLRTLDGNYASQTDSTRKYSLRASFLETS